MNREEKEFEYSFKDCNRDWWRILIDNPFPDYDDKGFTRWNYTIFRNQWGRDEKFYQGNVDIQSELTPKLSNVLIDFGKQMTTMIVQFATDTK